LLTISLARQPPPILESSVSATLPDLFAFSISATVVCRNGRETRAFLLESNCGFLEMLHHNAFIFLGVVHWIPPGRLSPPRVLLKTNKKPTWPTTSKVINHVGLLVNEPPDPAGLPFI